MERKENKKNLQKMLEKNLTTLIIELDITKCKKSMRQVIDLIQQLENGELTDNDLSIKDLYFK